MKDSPVKASLTQVDLLGIGTEPLAAVRAQFAALEAIVGKIDKALDDRTMRRVRHVQAQLAEFSTTVTIVGQVKAGKTALINVLCGNPGLLPSDVNPWTSVVTTLHINKPAPHNTKAEFRFFDKGEWERLMVGGGRLGEMAQRAGASEEMKEIERQVNEVRRKSQERLGKNFELLLGQRHAFDRFDTGLIERYVCLGDPDDPDVVQNKQGRFADLTRSADLYLDVPEYPVPLSFQDTPGVNDPFLMREQITLRAVRNTELCVVVLSANQALNTVDLALIRLLSTLDRRQVIIYVNRIDELQKPSTQIAEIRNSLLGTLNRHGVGGSSDIVFGSASWAAAALNGTLDDLTDASKHALYDWAMAAGMADEVDANAYAWKLAGMPSLVAAIGERVAEGAALRTLQKARKQLRNILSQAHASALAGTINIQGKALAQLGGDEVRGRANRLADSMRDEFMRDSAVIVAELKTRMLAANESFVSETVAAMLKHVEIYGAEGQWECDPMRLRMQLRAAYLAYSRSTRSLSQSILTRASRDMSIIYRDLLGDAAGDLRLEAPLAPGVPPPVAIGKTIVVDLQSTWWKRWVKLRRGADAFADAYRSVIEGETNGILREIEEQQIAAVNVAILQTLNEFFEDHLQTLTEITRAGSVDTDGLREILGDQEKLGRAAVLEAAIATLDADPTSQKLAATS